MNKGRKEKPRKRGGNVSKIDTISLPVGVVLLDIIISLRFGAELEPEINAVEKSDCALLRYESLLFNLN